MKKILVLLLVLSGVAFAQATTTPVKNKVDGKYTLYEDGTGQYRSNAVHVTNSGTTSNGALEATQLLIKKVLQAVRPSGKSYYSSLEGDFTATPIAGAAGKVVISGVQGFTFDIKDVVYAAYRRQAGDWTYLGFEPTIGVGDTIIFSGASFVSTDQVDIVIVNVPKTEDKANDANKSIEQSPIWARYTSDNLIAVTNNATGLVRYDYSGEGYNYQTLQFDVSASATSGIKLFATENDAASSTIETNWRDITSTVFGVDSLAFTTAQTVTYSISIPMQFKKWRVRVYYGHATNSVIAWIRRWF